MPLATAAGTIDTRTVWVLEIIDDAGRHGLGEAAPLPPFGGESPKDCDEALHQAVAMLTPELVGSWLERAKPDAPLGNLEPLLARTPCARHAVEGALLDLLAQSQKVPLAGLIAAHYATLIPVNAPHRRRCRCRAGRAQGLGRRLLDAQAQGRGRAERRRRARARAAQGGGREGQHPRRCQWRVEPRRGPGLPPGRPSRRHRVLRAAPGPRRHP